MTMSKELFLALLSMDAYNRGYAPGVGGLGGVGSRIGPATITKQSDTAAGSPGVNAGFYAIAYTVPDGAVDGITSGTITGSKGHDLIIGGDSANDNAPAITARAA